MAFIRTCALLPQRAALACRVPAPRRVVRVAVAAAEASSAAQAGGANSNCAAPKAKVAFQLPRHVEFGQQVCVVGADESLGCWKVNQAVPMSWTESDVWTAETELPAGTDQEYKFIIVDATGQVLEWAPQNNLVLHTPDATSTAAASAPPAAAAANGDPMVFAPAAEANSTENAKAAPAAAAAAPVTAPAGAKAAKGEENSGVEQVVRELRSLPKDPTALGGASSLVAPMKNATARRRLERGCGGADEFV